MNKQARIFHEAFKTEAGQQVLEHLEEVLVSPSYVKGDINETLVNEGRRLMVSYIKELVKHGGRNSI
jgi:hypothetical protein